MSDQDICGIRTFIDSQTRKVSKAWISNSALYAAFVQWVPWKPRLVRKFVSYQSFARFLGHTLKIPTVRRWVEGRQVYGRRLWPLKEIREKLNFGVDYL